MTQEDLDKCGNAVSSAVDLVLAGTDLVETGRATEALRYLENANEDAQRALKVLVSHGAQVDGLPPRPDIPLHLLNTRATGRLLSALCAAVDAARDVDAERGLDGHPSGWAETVAEVVARLRLEVEGPRGRGE